MIALKDNQKALLYPFFNNQKDTLIHTCLEGHMGSAWTDSIDNPSYALLQVGDFCYFKGRNQVIQQVFTLLPDITGRSNILFIPENANIERIIQRNYPSWHKVYRYAFIRRQKEFDIPYLEGIVSALPKEYELFSVDEHWYNKAMSEEWSKDLVSNFLSGEDFLKRGIGMVITCNNEIVSGASSYSIYNGGIEIQVDTKPDYRRKGLALIASAALIIACRERNIYPNWDAANEESVHMATKLGYQVSHSYTAFIISK